MTIDPVKTGLLLAAVVAGPSLYGLVRTGDMSVSTALEHAGLVALACAVGVAGINRLIGRYRIEQDRARRVAEVLRQLDEVVHEGTAVPPPEDDAP